jgi:Leucine-rich repeat (LRR) protein
MTGAAFGRKLECAYATWADIFWPSHKLCHTLAVDFSAKFETEKHSFSGNSFQKSETSVFQIHKSAQLDFIPLDILTEFPNLDGIVIWECNLPTVKAGLFRAEFKKIEFLHLQDNNIELIEPSAFQYLIKLKWVNLYKNNLQTLPYQIFRNNPDLIFISLSSNKISSIHPNFFDGLAKLKQISLIENLCIQTEIGCPTCSITQTALQGELKKCFDNCSQGTICEYLHKTSKIEENEAEYFPSLIESLELVSNDTKKAIEGVEKLTKTSEDLGKKVASLSAKMETELELGRNTTKEAIETINQKVEKLQQVMESQLKSMEEKLASIIQQKLSALENNFRPNN